MKQRKLRWIRSYQLDNITFAIYLPLLQIVNFCGGVSMSAIWASATSQGGFFNFTAWAGFLLSIGAFLLHALQIHQSVIIDLQLGFTQDRNI